MKPSRLLLILLSVLLAGFLIADTLYLSKFENHFQALERERIVTSNQLATAKIISENLNHVRDMVFQNMTFAGRKDSVGVDLGLYTFLTECSRDLKMKLLRIQPQTKETKGRIVTYGYDVEMEGDFFSFGEFCSKLENNRRIIALTRFDLSTLEGNKDGGASPSSTHRSLSLKLHLNTFQVLK